MTEELSPFRKEIMLNVILFFNATLIFFFTIMPMDGATLRNIIRLIVDDAIIN